MSENMKIWNAVKRPPAESLKSIRGGRLRGMTDISPQWRYMAMTETFGPCGVGWKFTIDSQTVEEGHGGEVFAFVNVSLYVKNGDTWSDPIPGSGGHKLVVSESGGMHNNDEAFKMATTDALSTAMKYIGVGADIYMGMFDGTKYSDTTAPSKPNPPKPKITPDQTLKILDLASRAGLSAEHLKKAKDFANNSETTKEGATAFIKKLEDMVENNPAQKKTPKEKLIDDIILTAMDVWEQTDEDYVVSNLIMKLKVNSLSNATINDMQELMNKIKDGTAVPF